FSWLLSFACLFFFFQAEDGIRDRNVTGVQTCALPILISSLRIPRSSPSRMRPLPLLTPAALISILYLRDPTRVSPSTCASSSHRSEERRVGKECRSGWATYHWRNTVQTEQARAESRNM